MTGYTREEAVGQRPSILKSGRQPAAFYESLWTTIRGGRVWQGELVNRRKDGTFYDEEMRIAPVADPNGEVAGYIAIKRDVTGRRAEGATSPWVRRPRKRNGSSPPSWRVPRTPSSPARSPVSSSPGTAARKRFLDILPERRSGNTCPCWWRPKGSPAWGLVSRRCYRALPFPSTRLWA